MRQRIRSSRVISPTPSSTTTDSIINTVISIITPPRTSFYPFTNPIPEFQYQTTSDSHQTLLPAFPSPSHSSHPSIPLSLSPHRPSSQSPT
ncbi:hypothetical protein M501DRAFT_640622 [Patellaria atrata CBS 101060]|uniref:Uncharacterized protein n=1 Tax=Patellaria atrata CBS 101060 TaxID=1346257 RepID=A0A9P4SFD9_9PEZI|nr:hypothetical protein M501DRAFT_640622 [Patellaria atrata CBS 101060]